MIIILQILILCGIKIDMTIYFFLSYLRARQTYQRNVLDWLSLSETTYTVCCFKYVTF